MKGGRFQNTAYLRTLASKQALNFATRRLIRDMKEIEENEIATVNVAAYPSEDDIFLWFANIVGPKGSLYEGAMYHLELRIPETYPMKPPLIKFLSPIHHPNVIGQMLCCDLVAENMPAGEGGWNSAYSIMSILLQLQSFLAEGSEKIMNQNTVKKEADIELIKKNNDIANDFKYNCSKHKGKADPWPKIKKIDEFNDDDFKTLKDEQSLYYEGLKCFHSKLGVDENHLGIGLKVTTIARNGEINQCVPILDYISLKSFYKNGVRRSLSNETFGFWLPLYFKQEHKEKTLFLAKKALSFICTNNSNRFETNMVAKVLVKCISTTILKIIEQKRHPSILVIRHLLNFHVLLLLFVREYPELVTYFDLEIEKFIKSEENRIKKNCPNLILIMVYLLFSEKYQFKDIINAYNEEQLDRQVFWILKKIPELEDDTGTFSVDENRVRVTFMSQVIGYMLVCFYNDYIKIIRGKFKTWMDMLEYMEKRSGKLEDSVENAIQKAFFDAEENIKDYKDYYTHIGVEVKSFDDICTRLKEAVKNSKRKKYHGSIDELLGLPSNNEQMTSFNAKREDLMTLIENGKLKTFTEDQWKEKVLKRWAWMNRYINHDYEYSMQPKDIAECCDEFKYEYSLLCEDHVDISAKYKEKFNMASGKRHRVDLNPCYENFTWRELFIKLDFEESTRFLNYTEDFKSYYAKLPVVSANLKTVVIYISKCENLKSGFFYLVTVLKELKGIHNLKIKTCGVPTVAYKALNNLKKGLSKTITNGCKVQHVDISGVNFDLSATSQECIYQIFEYFPHMISLRINESNILSAKNNKLITSVLTNHPDIRQIWIRKAINNDQIGKSFADGLMRTKKIENITVLENTTGNSITNILYNLSFAPRLTFLDASGNIPSNFADFVENMGKMININASLEYLILDGVTGLVNNLSLDFFKYLAENQSLKALSLNNSKNSVVSYTIINYMAQSLALNAFKKGGLVELHLGNGIIGDFNMLNNFFNSMYYSNKLHEEWYGDSTKASKMGGDDITCHYKSNLKILNISHCNFVAPFRIHLRKVQEETKCWAPCLDQTFENRATSHPSEHELLQPHLEFLRGPSSPVRGGRNQRLRDHRNSFESCSSKSSTGTWSTTTSRRKAPNTSRRYSS
jgi:ubiquitin-protein ligase